MEVIQFNNHVEMVEAAQRLLTADYKISYCPEKDTCLYRMVDDEGEERRCIIGRLFYGHIPESHPFWDYHGSLGMAWTSDFFADIREKFSWLNPKIGDMIQDKHDSLAGILVHTYFWDEIRAQAEKADAANIG